MSSFLAISIISKLQSKVDKFSNFHFSEITKIYFEYLFHGKKRLKKTFAEVGLKFFVVFFAITEPVAIIEHPFNYK